MEEAVTAIREGRHALGCELPSGEYRMCACWREIAEAAQRGEDLDFEELRLPPPIENGGRLHFKLGEMGHLRCSLCKRPLVLDDWGTEKECACWEAVDKPRGYPEKYPWPLPEGRAYRVEEAFVTMVWRAVPKPPPELAAPAPVEEPPVMTVDPFGLDPTTAERLARGVRANAEAIEKEASQ